MDDGKLIELVCQFRFLYDKKDSNFKNKVKRENAWQTISAIMGMGATPIECDQRWSVIRSKYATLKRTSKNRPSGSEAYTITWPYYSQMKFLDPFIKQRRTTTNYSAVQAPQESCSYSGVHEIIDTENDPVNDSPDEDISESFEIQSQSDLDQSVEDNETQMLYEYFITKRKQPPNLPAAKKIKSTICETQPLQESQILHNNKKLNEIRKLQNIRKPKSKDSIVDKLGGCLNTFEKFIEAKNPYQEDEDFVRSLSRDLTVFTPAEKISLKRKFYECMDEKLREKTLNM